MNWIDSQIANIDKKKQQLQKIVSFRSDEQDIFNTSLTAAQNCGNSKVQNLVRAVKGVYFLAYVYHKINRLLFKLSEYSPNIDYLDACYYVASKVGATCNTGEVFGVLKSMSDEFSKLLLLKYGNTRLYELFEEGDEDAFKNELAKIDAFNILLICGFELLLLKYSDEDSTEERIENEVSDDVLKGIINTLVLKLDDGDRFLVNTSDFGELEKGKEIISYDDVSKNIISTFSTVFEYIPTFNNTEKALFNTIYEKCFYKDDLWKLYFQAYAEKFGIEQLNEHINYLIANYHDLADYINANKDSYLVNEQSEATTTECEETEGISDNERNYKYPFDLHNRRRLRNKTLIDEVCKKYLSKWFKNKIDDVPYIKYVFFEYGIPPTDKLVFTGKIKDLVSFLLFLNGSGDDEIWNYINQFIVNKNELPVLRNNPRSNVKEDSQDAIGRVRQEIGQAIGRKLNKEEEEDLK